MIVHLGSALAAAFVAALLAQMEPSYAFAALMFAISVGTLIFSVIQNKNKASNEYVDKLEARILHLELELEKCEAKLLVEATKNFELMKEILTIRANGVRQTKARAARAKVKRDNADH